MLKNSKFSFQNKIWNNRDFFSRLLFRNTRFQNSLIQNKPLLSKILCDKGLSATNASLYLILNVEKNVENLRIETEIEVEKYDTVCFRDLAKLNLLIVVLY